MSQSDFMLNAFRRDHNPDTPPDTPVEGQNPFQNEPDPDPFDWLDFPDNDCKRAKWAKGLIRKEVARELKVRRGPLYKGIPEFDLSKAINKPLPGDFKVCIVGAGMSGLYLAMMLEFLNIDYTILEGSDRIGGRVYTHDFREKDSTGRDIPKSDHNYYDVGAMRFPEIEGMRATFNLFRHFQKTVKLEPYLIGNNQAPRYINHRFDDAKAIEKSMTRFVKTFKPAFKALEDDFSIGFNLLMKQDRFSTYEYLRKYLDLMKAELDPKEIFDQISEWELHDSGTGLFYQAFSETVLDYYDFSAVNKKLKSENKKLKKQQKDAKTLVAKPQTPDDDSNTGIPSYSATADTGAPAAPPSRKPRDTDWWRVEGGTSRIVDAMLTKIKSKPLKNHEVVAIQRNQSKMEVTYIAHEKKKSDAETTTESFDAVFNTTTLGCLHRMNLGMLPDTGTFIGQDQHTAIRSLEYDVSVKVAIKFKEPWWITKCGMTKPGGVSKTDLPIRSIVYPSWVNDLRDDELHEHQAYRYLQRHRDKLDEPCVLMVSYTWSQDAARMHCLTNPSSPANEDRLKELTLRNLATLYSNPDDDATLDNNKLGTISYPELCDLYIDHHSYSWSENPFTADAFAKFGAGQFSNLYPALRRSISGSDNRLWVCGEAVSAHHAWIAGALVSSFTALAQFLIAFGCYDKYNALKDSWFGEPNRKLPEETEEQILYAIGQLGMDEPTDEDFRWAEGMKEQWDKYKEDLRKGKKAKKPTVFNE